MNDQRKEERVAELLRLSTGAPPDSAFRERVRRHFRNGSLVGQPVPISSARRRDRLWRWTAVAAATAAVLSGILLLRYAPEPRSGWRVTALEGEGEVWVDGVVAPRGFSALAEQLREGVQVQTHGVTLELLDGRRFAIRIEPGSELRLPRARSESAFEAHLQEGAVHFATGPAFPGSHLSIRAGEVSAFVKGTTLSVTKDDTKICVSVLEGEVEFRAGAGDPGVVPAGRCRTVFTAVDAASREEALKLEQRVPLEALHARAQIAFQATP